MLNMKSWMESRIHFVNSILADEVMEKGGRNTMKDKVLVYQNMTCRYLRCVLAASTLFMFYLSGLLGYIWLYAISTIFLIIVVIMMSLLYSYVAISDRGIELHYGFWKSYELKWEDVHCCGTFSLKILGAVQKEEYIYFSRKPVTYYNLVNSVTLPAQSKDFLFFSKQNKALASIKNHIQKSKKFNF